MGKSVEVLRLCRVYLHDDDKWWMVHVADRDTRTADIFIFQDARQKRKSTDICFCKFLIQLLPQCAL